MYTLTITFIVHYSRYKKENQIEEAEKLSKERNYKTHTHTHMNNHIYSTLFKIQERKSDRRSREVEQRKELQNTHTGHVTLIYCINIKSPSSLNGLEKYIFKYLIKIC